MMSWLISAGIAIACIWAILLFVDSCMRSYQSYRYLRLLDRLGVSLKIGQLKWSTTRYNRMFVWLGSRRPRCFHVWFSAGAVLGVLLMVPATCVLVFTIRNNMVALENRSDKELLSTVLPGVNLPTADIPYYVTTFILSIVFHELGHALAAVREEIKIHGCGLIVIGVLPAAFVDIATDQMSSSQPWKQLRVFCAGIWHNFILVVMAVLLLFALPWALTVGYSWGQGVAVRDVKENLAYGLAAGDHVTAINDCFVTDFDSWYGCLYRSTSAPQSGFCIDDTHLETYKWNDTGLTVTTEVIDCCPMDDPRGVCFAWLNPSTIPQKFKSYSCLPARKLIKLHSASCFSEEECESGSSCVVPALENTTRLVQVARANREDALYVCQVSDLYHSVSVSEYVPRIGLLPVNWPYYVEMFLKYLVSFSGALGLLNAVPCYALDGQWIAMAVVELGLAPFVHNRSTRNTIYQVVVLFGTVLLGLTIVTGIRNIA